MNQKLRPYRSFTRSAIALTVLVLASFSTVSGEIVTTTSWLGNTSGTPEGHIMQDITDLAVTPDGKVVAATPWDEGGTNAAVYQNGAMIGRGLDSGTGSWGRMSNGVVATDASYFYLSIKQGGGYGGVPSGQSRQEIKRYNFDGTPAGFTGGVQFDFSVLNVVTASDAENKPVAGLVTYNNELYAADSYSNTIKVYQLPLASQSVKRSWSITRPGRLEVDSAGYIWMLQVKDATNAARLIRYSSTGVLQSQQILFTSAVDPWDFAIDRAGNRILVTNNGVDQNVLIYSNITTAPTQTSTFGATGGIFSGTPGAVGPQKLTRPSGVGIDSAGNIYVANNGTGLEAYSPGGTRLWELLSQLFVDTVDAVAGAETVVYGARERFALDYSQTTPGTEWSYQGYTLNPFKYPDDPRLHLGAASVFTAVIGGKTFLYMTGMYGEPLAVYRFNAATDGEVAIPAGLFAGSGVSTSWLPNQPTGEWVWNDSNGNGAFDSGEYSQPANPQTDTNTYTKYVDSRGTVWDVNGATGKIRSFPCQGLDANGTPVYNYNKVQETAPPSSLVSGVNYLMYDADTDVMFLTGYTAAYPAPSGYGAGVTGHALMRISDWSSGNRTPAWTVEVPMDLSIDQFSKSITSAGDYIFSVECRRNNPVTVFSKATGAQVATLLPGAAIGGRHGWVDIPYGINATQRANGEYVVFVEDDGYLKNVMYRMNDGLAVKATTPSFSLAPGTYDETQTVTISSDTSGAILRYTTDGTLPTSTTGTVYTGPVSLSSTATLRAIAYKSGFADSHVASGYYIVNSVVATPTFSPTPDMWKTSPLWITISSTSGAAIRYTTDGSTPTTTTGTVYAGPMSIAVTTTFKAIAYRAGMTDSAVATGAFTISSAEARLTPIGGDSFLSNGNTTEWQSKPLPYTYNLGFNSTVQLDRLVLWMPSTWGGPVNMTAEIRGGMTPGAMTTIVGPTVYSISGSVPVNLTIPATNLQYVQIVISATHNGAGNLSEVEIYGRNVQIQTSPAAPVNLSAIAASSSHINVTWTDNSANETAFEIDRATDSGFTSNLLTTTVGANVTTYQATGLTAATTYYFRIRATNTFGDSANTTSASATTWASLSPAPSALSATTASDSRINLAWNDTSGNETGFKIDHAMNSDFTLNLMTSAVGANVTTYQATGLIASTTYYFRVRATNASGDSPNTASANAITFGRILTPPAALNATAASSSQINLAWTDNSGNETGFKINRATDSGFTANLVTVTVGANVTTYQAAGLTAGTIYYFRVRATDSAGDSPNTATASAATLPNNRLIPNAGDLFLFNGNTAEWSPRPLPATYNLSLNTSARANRLVLWMPSAWGGPVDMTAEIRGGMRPGTITTLVAPTVYSISGSGPVNITIPPTTFLHLQIIITATHNGQGNLSEVEIYGTTIATLPALTVAVSGSSAIISTSTSVAGFNYSMFYSDTLSEESWQPMTGNPKAGGGILTWTNAITDAPQRFYRLKGE